MQCSMMWAGLLLGLAVAVTASEVSSERPPASNVTSRALPATTGRLLQTVDELLTAALGPAGRAAGPVGALQALLAAVPIKLAGLKAALVAAAPGIAIAALVIGIIALAKVGALYKKLGLSAFDTVHEALPKFGHPGHGFPEHGEYDGYGRYDPSEYAYHDDSYDHGGSSYAGYASRGGQAAGRVGDRAPAAQARFGQTESRVVRRTQAAAEAVPQTWNWQ
ncbi:hypothetical protein FJT64_015054 [Amphibalanus amphitrite]|uniref:Uncharacterized protein n=1 Tax=Amphibalanus amphitrite TaxID=1232801 RepID=A0A6A4X5G5_AMPAM|nr:hypothetical protein FJT64_015054 [Amphibalanus amphitrite]